MCPAAEAPQQSPLQSSAHPGSAALVTCTPTSSLFWPQVPKPSVKWERCSARGCRSSPVAVVVEMVVTGQSEEDTESRTQGEENLCSSINPDLAGEAMGRLEKGQGSLGLGRGVGGTPWHAHPKAQGWVPVGPCSREMSQKQRSCRGTAGAHFHPRVLQRQN